MMTKMNRRLFRIFKKSAKIFNVISDMKVSDYVSLHRRLSSEESIFSGTWSNERAPWLVDIMNTYNDNNVRTVSLMCSAQIGKTECLNNIFYFVMAEDPCKILVVQSTREMALTYSRDKLTPMIDNNSQMINKIINDGNKKGNNLLYKRFIGGSISIVGGGAVGPLTSRSVRITFVDDCDQLKNNLKNQGKAIELAEKRTKSFPNRKNYRAGTPTIEGDSESERLFLAGSQEYFTMICPNCKKEFWFNHENFDCDKQTDFDGNIIAYDFSKVCYKCECGHKMYEHDKPALYKNAYWKAKNPERIHDKSYHLNEFYPYVSNWSDVYSRVIKFLNDPEGKMAEWNNTLGLPCPIETQIKLTDFDYKSRLREFLNENNPYIPNDIVAITQAIDVQDYRLELIVKGWTKEKKSYTIDYKQFPFQKNDPLPWSKIDYFVSKLYQRDDKIELRPIITLIDSGGHHTEEVYKYVVNNTRRNVFAIRGLGGLGTSLFTESNSPTYNVIFYNLRVDMLKDMLFKRIHFVDQPKEMFFNSQCCDYEYFQQLFSEKKVIKYVRGNISISFTKKYENARNEVLDMEVYNLAAIELFLVGKNFNYLFELDEKLKTIANKGVSNIPFISSKGKAKTYKYI